MKKIAMFAAASVLAFVVGAAIVNRLKAKIPMLGTVIGA